MRLSEEFQLVAQFMQNPPVDLNSLAKALRVEVSYAFLSPKISGLLENNDGKYTISVNNADPETRQRFTLAHEIGHYLLHRHLIGQGIEDDRAYRSTNSGKYANTKIGARQETEANKFAASILMPTDAIKRFKADGVDVQEMARRLNVSEHAMSIRLNIPYQQPFL